ncbi:MAG: type II toxin-antitoxin system Phd/YefM family antitoxin [Nitrospirae bacterium]|nr:type II toxin-antitoxin system Phd/YefM family antitoxin [Nitrospirota bacterium]
MLKTISAIKVRQNLGQVMNEVALKDDEYIIERAGKPLVAIIPIEQYQGMKKERKEFFQMVDEIQKGIKKAAGSLIDTEIEEAVQSYRKGISQKFKKTGK